MMIGLDFGLKKETIDAINGVFRQFPEVESAVIYGSRAKGNFRPNSDIDLTIKGSRLDLTSLLRIETALDELLLPYKIDVSIFHHIENKELLEHINRVGLVFYKGPNEEGNGMINFG